MLVVRCVMDVIRDAVRVGWMFMLCIPMCETFGWIKAAVSVCYRFYTIYQNYISIFILFLIFFFFGSCMYWSIYFNLLKSWFSYKGC